MKKIVRIKLIKQEDNLKGQEVETKITRKTKREGRIHQQALKIKRIETETTFRRMERSGKSKEELKLKDLINLERIIKHQLKRINLII